MFVDQLAQVLHVVLLSIYIAWFGLVRSYANDERATSNVM
jgi:hypothetical protein